MANTKFAKKAIRSSLRKKAVNNRKKSAYKDAQKKLIKTATAKESNATSLDLLTTAYKALDKAAKANVIHKKKAARLKSRLAKKVAKK